MSSILSVSQLNKYVQFKIKSDLKLRGITVKGEVSNFSLHYKSGHAYFSLKDESSVVKCVMFSGSAQKLKFTPENGMKALVSGNLEVYERDGVYQIIVSDMQPLGIGAVYTGIEQVKEKLKSRGVFDQSVKKPVPFFPRKIAVVTSLTGAALQDILNILSRRFPICSVLICPAQVQGGQAADSICAALNKADSCGADTIILARGGGSSEDLMPFNTEAVAMAIFSCKTPLISAVGHETDTTLADYAADLRTPTPSAAAEQATPDISVLFSALSSMRFNLDNAIRKCISDKSVILTGISSALNMNSPAEKLENSASRIKDLRDKLDRLVTARVKYENAAFDKYVVQLQALSPFSVLDRGYTITTKDGKAVYSAAELNSGDKVEIRFRDSSRAALME
ncbi:exodeoxyribonuclease VII large subunit [Ruminococcus sp. Marseille-P6503]|uniref:exodeoxyribonuclease VII large subunit n=1 Tax=Ruminococcus sp. Marseille-P6503 TaxID=2364796 RepID=UPI000F539AFB|nr:exodeoxyribonuclease VII large subunit [Ruminococcus sp. Marseille-P6503]